MDGTGGSCAWWDVGKETEKTTQVILSPLAARPLPRPLTPGPELNPCDDRPLPPERSPSPGPGSDRPQPLGDLAEGEPASCRTFTLWRSISSPYVRTFPASWEPPERKPIGVTRGHLRRLGGVDGSHHEDLGAEFSGPTALSVAGVGPTEAAVLPTVPSTGPVDLPGGPVHRGGRAGRLESSGNTPGPRSGRSGPDRTGGCRGSSAG